MTVNIDVYLDREVMEPAVIGLGAAQRTVDHSPAGRTLVESGPVSHGSAHAGPGWCAQ